MVDEFDTVLSGDQIRTHDRHRRAGDLQQSRHEPGREPVVGEPAGRAHRGARVGRRLFERTKAGVKLNNDGEAVLIYSRAVAKLGEGLRRQLAASTSTRCSCASASARISPARRCSRRCWGCSPAASQASASRPSPQRRRRNCSTRSTGATSTWWWASRSTASPAARYSGPVLPPGWAAPTSPCRSRIPCRSSSRLWAVPLRAMMLEALQGASRRWRVVFESSGLATLEAALRAGLGVAACPVRMDFTRTS